MFSLHARISQRDREQNEWSSHGNTRITRTASGRIKNVHPGLIYS